MTIHERQLWAAFLSVNEIGPRTFRRILEFVSFCEGSVSLEEVWNNTDRFSDSIRFTDEQLHNLTVFQNKYSIQSFYDYLQSKNILVITELDDCYPPLLQQCEDRPPVLFVKGNVDILTHHFPIAVVGTRKITGYGKTVTAKLVAELANNGACIVSGLMVGVDSFAHKVALARHAPTVGVVGYGFDHCYPIHHKSFIEEFQQSGGVMVSLWPPDVWPVKGNFITRNRVVAGMSLAVVVTEATNPSGTFHTVNFGLEYNRSIYAVPGPITSTFSEGTKTLVNQGAQLVSSGNDIIDDLRFQTGIACRTVFKPPQLTDPIQQRIYESLQEQPATSDELYELLQLDISTLHVALSQLEISGVIQQCGEAWSLNLASSDP